MIRRNIDESALGDLEIQYKLALCKESHHFVDKRFPSCILSETLIMVEVFVHERTHLNTFSAYGIIE